MTDAFDLADRLDLAAWRLRQARRFIRGVAEELRGPDVPWSRDISAELDTNPGPYENEHLQRDGGWWPRRLDQIDKVTIHHTLSDSPHATARHYVDKDGGRPTLPYSIWISQTGEVLLAVPLEQGLWHDHSGHANTHLSVGLAGTLHLYRPAEVQLIAAVEVCVWAIKTPDLPRILTKEDVTGHQDWVATACPGWNKEASGFWKPDFYAILEGMLDE